MSSQQRAGPSFVFATSIELFNLIFKNALIRRNVRVFASNNKKEVSLYDTNDNK